MPILKRRETIKLLLTLAANTMFIGAALANEPQTALKIAVAASASNAAVEIAAKEAKAIGLDVQIIEFSDWNTPNMAVAHGDADANLFQHKPYLEFTNQKTGNHLIAIAHAFATPFGLYSKRYQKLEDLPNHAKIAFSGDAVNTGRSLLLLQQANLLELKPGTSHLGTLQDVVRFKKPLQIIQLDGPQIARTLDEVDAAATYPTFAKAAGLEANSALIAENNPLYAFQFVTRADNKSNPQLLQFIEIYQNSQAAKAKLQELYGDSVSFPR